MIVINSLDDAIKELIRLFEFERTKDAGIFCQEPYKGNLFNVFKSTYGLGGFERNSRPLMTGDNLRPILDERWVKNLKKSELDRAYDVMDKALLMWDNWHYAWNNYDL